MFSFNLFANPKTPDLGGWASRHNNAVNYPVKVERNIVGLAHAIAGYCQHYSREFGSPIAEDAILGQEAILPMIRAFRTLLNGELGRLDAGTLDAWILAVAKEAGFTEEDL